MPRLAGIDGEWKHHNWLQLASVYIIALGLYETASLVRGAKKAPALRPYSQPEAGG